MSRRNYSTKSKLVPHIPSNLRPKRGTLLSNNTSSYTCECRKGLFMHAAETNKAEISIGVAKMALLVWAIR